MQLCIEYRRIVGRIILNNIQLGTVNVNSICNKVGLVSMMMMSRDVGLDVLVVTEAWLVPAVAASFVGDPRYAIVRGATDSK